MRFVPLLGLLFCVAALAQAPVAGFTSGSLRVTESGAAEYRIPLRVPPGIAGLEPKLALVYNSQAGNGPFGVGWNLEGLSAITRCPRTMAQDGARGGVSYDGGDRFCLDGQRLVAIGGAYGESETEYRTERESFSKIVSYGQAGSGPAWFKVRTKAGHVMEYGRTEDSRIQAHLKEAVRVWAVNRISDQNGNDLTVAYNEDGANGEFYPLRIDYAGNGGAAAASVRFVPEARPDVATAYVARSVVRTLSRIAGITTYLTTDTADVLIKDYRLSYVQPSSTQRSVVATVTECGSGQGCLPGIQVGTSADSGPVFGHWSWINAIPMINWDASGLKSFLADVNGDGRADLVHTQHGYFYVGLSEGTGFGHWSWSSAIPMINWDAAGVQSFLADVNGDGRADLVHTQHGTFYVGLSDGLGFGHWSWSSPMPMINWDAPGAKSFLADVNGDGRADLVHTQNGSFYVGLSDGLGFGHWSWINPIPMINWDANGVNSFLADVNGDGRADLVHTQNGSFYVGSRSDPLPDLAASVTDSLLRTHSIAYKPLTDGAVYAKDSGVDAASYPNLDLQPALHVVHSIASSSGAGGVRTTTHKYGGLKASHEGRGSLGFRWQDSYQTVDGTQLRTRAEFRQDWPYLGLTSVVRKSRGADALLGQVTNQYDCRDPLSGNACTVTAGNRFFPFVWRSVESGADLNGAALPTVTTDTQYDGAGNPTRVEVSTPDGYRKTTTNSYAPPDTANWRLGRLLRSTVESASP